MEASGYCSRAVKKDGSAVVFGLNEYAQHMPPDADFAVVTCGGFHTIALKLDGSLAAWGWNAFRQCEVPSGRDYVAVAAGGRHSMALKNDSPVATASVETYKQFDTFTSRDFLAVARGIYYRVAVLGEPVILLLLGFLAVLLYKGLPPMPKVLANGSNHNRKNSPF